MRAANSFLILIVIVFAVASFNQIWFEKSFSFFVFTCVPNCNFSIWSSSCKYPRDIFTELHGKKFSLFHISEANFIWISSSVGGYIPYLTDSISTTCAHHVWNMWTKNYIRASFFMSLNSKNWVLYFTTIITEYLTTFHWNSKIVFQSWMPSYRFNIFSTLRYHSSQTTVNISYIGNIDSWIITSCQQNLIIYIIPLNSLNLICVKIFESSFTF